MRTTLRVCCAILFALLVTAAAADLPAPPRHDFPRVGAYEVLCGDFHMHTVRSDGKLTTRERVEESYALGYDVISITDHGRTGAYRAANHLGSEMGLVVLRGIETGVKGKEHVNAIGIDYLYKPVNPHAWAEQPGQSTIYYREQMARIAAHGGIIIYNHPHVGYREPVHWGIEQRMLIGIEVKNDEVADKWGTTKSHGTNCYPDAFDFALKHNLAIFANTDVHRRRSKTPARTLVFAAERTPEGVMEAIRARRTAAWFDGMLWGREKLLADLMAATMQARVSAEGKTVIENNGPVAFRGEIQGSAGEVDLPAYGSAVIGAIGAGPIRVRWTNIWTSPEANLITEVTRTR